MKDSEEFARRILSVEMPKFENPLKRSRATPSPLTASKKRSSGQKKSNLPSAVEGEERLDDTGVAPSIAPRGVAQDVSNLIRYIHAHMWTEMPDRAAGMGSERISEVLRFRDALPRIVSVAHLHALSTSSTNTERELARLIARGAVRKVVVPGRGKGGAAAGEGVVLTEDWKTSIRESSRLSDQVREKYLSLMDAHPATGVVPTTPLSSEEVRELVQAGYLTSPSALSANLSNLFAQPGASSLSTIGQSGSKAATGTLAAVGGSGAIHDSGGGGSVLATSQTRHNNIRSGPQQSMTLSLPSTGAYLKLLVNSRQQLLNLLKQLSPRYKEATLELLREKWDGNIPTDAASRAKRMRGEGSTVLPGKTRKWREFWGLEFDWVLAECVGSGLVELFETGSVGIGVRAC